MKRFAVILLGTALICAGCGSKDKSEDYFDSGNYGEITEAEYDGYDMDSIEEAYGNDADYSGAGSVYSEYESVDNASYEGTADVTSGNTAQTGGAEELDKEMLVYQGDISIDTLDFDNSVSGFNALISEKGGFVESESYTDNYLSDGYYAVDEESKHNVYTATVRVPSTEYDSVMNSAADFGDVRSKNSNASNVTQEYGTYESQLEIYQAEYDRYLELLEGATEDEYALAIENELFDIQIQIANLKSSITNIENDVAYSYIDVTINEVSEYEEEPAKTDTFADRFANTCRDSWEGFVGVLEDILFSIIMNIYYIIIVAVVIVVIIVAVKRKKSKRDNVNSDAGIGKLNQTTVEKDGDMTKDRR